MKPKKKSTFAFWCGLILLILTLYVCVILANAYQDAVDKVGEKAKNFLNEFGTFTLDRIQNKPFQIKINDYTQRFVLIGLTAWLIGAAYFSTSRKNFIHGKEFGTARWGTRGDIRALFAEVILKQEIKDAKKTRFVITRFLIKKRIYKECERNGQKIRAQMTARLKDEEYQLELTGKGKQKQYKYKKREIDKKVREIVTDSKIESWKPDSLKHSYKLIVKDINERFGQRLLTKDEREIRLRSAAKKYDNELRDFYCGASRLKSIKEKYAHADMLLTQSERISIHNLELNSNVLILGGSGSGKTRGFVMPNVLQAHSSYVITDPKGEILEKSGRFLSEIQGYNIRVLNLDNKEKSDGYNPFVYIHPERIGYEERVLMLIEAIIINTDGGEKKGGHDPFWDKAERLFLQAIFFFTCDGFCENERNMNTVLELIGMLQIIEENDNYNSELDSFAEIFEKDHGKNHIGVQQYKEFRSKASGKTAKSIVISAVARLAPFRTSSIRRIFRYDTIELDKVGEQKTVVFVIVPPTDSTFNFIAGMLFTQLFQELQYCASEVHKHEGQKLPVPVRFILDEFANTCTIPNFVKILAYARSFGIGIVPILQSLEQIKNMYKDEWGVIVDNCNSLLFLGSITHMDTLEYISKLLGKGTFDKKTYGRTRSKHGSSSTNFDVIGRELMLPDEIRKLPKDECLLIIGGRSPFRSKKYEYKSHENYRFTSDANISYAYAYEPRVKYAEIKNKADASQPNDNGNVKKIPNIIQSSENTVIAVDEIKMNVSYQNILNRMGRNFAHYIPVPDAFTETEDGEEMSDEDAAKWFDILDDKESSKAADDIFAVSDGTAEIINAAGKNIIDMNSNAVSIATRVCRVNRNLIPVPDGLLTVDDGEKVLTGEQEHCLFDELLEESNNVKLQEIITKEEDLVASLRNELANNLPRDIKDRLNQGQSATA